LPFLLLLTSNLSLTFMTLTSNYVKFLLAILWLIFVTYLFCLPGAALPKADWMSRIWFDKWVHIGVFIGLVFLWSRALQLVTRKSLLLLILIAVVYGFVIEIVQDRFIPNRSFDWSDLLADFVGCMIGLRVWLRGIKK
jgi:VanZ like family